MGFSAAIVSAAVAVLAVIIAAFRRQRSSSIYAAGYVSGAIGFCLLMTQGMLGQWISVVLANLLAAFLQTSLAWGMRTKTANPRPWPWRFWLYLGALAAALIIGWKDFSLRSIAVSVHAMVLALEFLLATSNGQKPAPPFLRKVAWIMGLAYFAAYSFRIMLLALGTAPRTFFVNESFYSAFSLSFIIFFMVLWAGLVLVIDAADLLAELEHKNKVLTDFALSDELTGLYNRHLLEANLRSDMDRSVRYQEPISLVLFDLDHFKNVNDSYGHQTGDEVLKQVAAIVKGLIRKSDTAYRWGGEEFLVVLHDTSVDGALRLAEKTREAVAAATFPMVGKMTASFGVAEWGGKESLEQWFRRTDLAMYRAKNNGRNRVEALAPESDPSQLAFKIEWKPLWDSDNLVIDGQHRALVGLCNELLARALSQAPQEEISALLDELMSRSTRHFSDEESILSEAAYPKLEEHRQLHHSLLVRAQELKGESHASPRATSSYFDFLVDELIIGHIAKEDSKFFPLLRARNASASN